MQAQNFYEPMDRGFEARIKERLDYWNERRKALQQSGDETG
jgi:putative ATPase